MKNSLYMNTAVRLFLVFSILVWNLGPAIAVAADEVAPPPDTPVEQPAATVAPAETSSEPAPSETSLPADETPLTQIEQTAFFNEAFVYTPLALPGADLSITKTDNKTEVDAGVEDTYAIQIVNNSTSAAANVVLTDSALELTGTIQYKIGSGAWTDWPSGNIVGLGNIGSGGVRNVFIKGTVPADATSISNTASVSSDTPDPNMSNNSATDVTTVLGADLSITKTDNKTEVDAGAEDTYAIQIVNNGPATAANVVLTDSALDLTGTIQYRLGSDVTWTDWPVSNTVNFGNISNGGVRNVFIKGTVPADVTSISNTALVSSDIRDPDTSNNSATKTTTVRKVADLSITKTDGQTSVDANTTDTYSIVVTNAGPSQADSVSLSDVSPLIGSEYSLNNITWNTWSSPYSLGSIASGSSKTVYIRGTVPSDVTSISNTATVSSDTFDPNLANNSATDTTTVMAADLAITKTDNKTEVDAGVENTYAIQVTNSGPGTAANVVLTDAALGFTGVIQYRIGSGAWIDWPVSNTVDLGSIGSAGVRNVFIKGTVPADATSISNTASVSSDTYDPDMSDNSATDTTTVLGADLSITKTDNKTEVDAGAADTYAIQIVNNGPATAANVVLADSVLALTGNVQYRLGSDVTWTDWPAGNTVGLGSIGNGGVRNVFIKGTVPSDVASIANTASVSSDIRDPNTANNSATDETAVRYGSISGVLWNDLNQNDIQDPGELPLSGWTVWLDPVGQILSAGMAVADVRLGISSSHFMTDITDGNGLYEFNMLPPGDYILGVEAPPGWQSTFPPGFTVEVSVSGNQSTNPGVLYGFGGAVIPAAVLPYTGK